MISSAVVIPEESEALLPPSHEHTTSLKRRQSEISESPEPSKRPRLDTQSSIISNTHNGATSPSSPRATRNASSPTMTTSTVVAEGGQAMSPPRRRPTANNDEKSRNRRLFGALLGNLAQPTSTRTKPSRTATATATTAAAATASRREDIESRQRQRLQRESEEISQNARRKKEELNRTRRIEQRRWDEQGIRIKHANMRATAGFLRTSTEPRLYYKPWELRAEEEEIVKRQKDEVEETIRREWEAWEKRKAQEEENEKADVRAGSPDDRRQESDAEVRGGDTNGTADSRRRSEDVPTNGDVNVDVDVSRQAQERPPSPSSDKEDEKDSVSSPARLRTEGNRPSAPGSDRPQSSKDDDHGGEELELGQEDDVIY